MATPVAKFSRVQFFLPTGPEFLLMVHDATIGNLKQQKPGELQAPSLYRRALILQYRTQVFTAVEATVEAGTEL